MGFPTWTLWGMGLAAFGALLAIALAFLAQSPRLISRLGLTGQRLDLRAKSFTGYGLALLLLAMGFFLAGVPLDAVDGATATEVAELTGEDGGVAGTIDLADETPASETGQSQTGAMGGLPTPGGDAAAPGGASGAMTGIITSQATLEPSAVLTETLEATAVITGPVATEESPVTATLAPTATETPTPSPTPSPTPILVPTARINDETSTLPLRRLPGGPVLVVLLRGDTVIPLAGNSFYSGEAWQEIMTVNGVVGWVQDRYLNYGGEETAAEPQPTSTVAIIIGDDEGEGGDGGEEPPPEGEPPPPEGESSGG